MSVALELISQRDLHNARVARGADFSKSGFAVEVRPRRIQVNIVERVEEVAADRSLVTLSERLLH